MRVQSLVFALVVLLAFHSCIFSVHAEEAEEDHGDVVVLTEKNFDQFVNSHELSLIEFYAPWCGHCKSLAPEYKEAATALLGKIPLAKVDCTKESSLASRFQVNGYPTLKVFRHSKPTDYNGPRKAAGIVAYMQKQVGPAAKPVSSEDDVKKLLSSASDSNFIVLGFFSSTNSQLYSSFTVLANRLRDDFVFGKVEKNAELAKTYGVDGDGIVAVRGTDKVVYSGTSKTSAVESFIRENSVPLVGEMTEGNSQVYEKRGLPIAKFFLPIKGGSAQRKPLKYYVNRLTKIATEVQGKAVVTYVDKSSEFARRDTDHFNVGAQDFGLVVIDSKNDKSYRYESIDFDVKAMSEFITNAVLGVLPTYVRSEIPPKYNDGPVKIVTGTTFNQIVMDDSKDILIEFYAPWCGHCKSLEPKYTKLGERFAGNDDVVIAKLDATANDFDRNMFKVSGYPTIYFKPAKANAKPIKYEGDREVDAMESFIRKNAHNSSVAAKKKKSKKSKKSKSTSINHDEL